MSTRKLLQDLVFFSFLFSACTSEYPPPPATERSDVVDMIHGETVPDPYRWLEDQNDPRTRAWIDAQNKYAERIIGETPIREHLRSKLREFMGIVASGSPRKGGEYEFFTLRRKGEELSSIFRRKAPENNELIPIDPEEDYELIVDPNPMSPDHTTKVEILSVSSDGKFLLYSVRDGGQDEIEVRLRDIENNFDRDETLPNALYSNIFFAKTNNGFYYTHRSRKTGPRVMFHQLGTSFEKDKLLFGKSYGPRNFINASSLNDDAFLLLTVQHGWARSELHLKNMENDTPAVPLSTGANARFYARFGGGRLFVRTNLNATNNQLMEINLKKPSQEYWITVVPERKDVLQDFTVIDGKLYLTYLHDVSSEIKVFELDGTEVGEIPIPPYSVATIQRAGMRQALLTVESLIQPRNTYILDLDAGTKEIWKSSDIPFKTDDFTVKQVRYESKDGTTIPMYVAHSKGLELSGDTPTILTGYGGFNAARVPRFDTMASIWMEHGGVFALANLRGGSEYGEQWHRDGMLENKQNVFDDFIAAGDWLVENNYTNPNRLAIRGASNGGLLVGSALTQRPNLFRAVLCGFPDLDMVRFHTFTDSNNMPALLEYGDAGISEQFAFLRKYSPYQAVQEGESYPAVMLTSGDLDTRVPPLQARKMTARFQGATSSGLPVILRYHPKAGHAGGRGVSLSQRIEDNAAELSFLFSQVGKNGLLKQ